MTDKFSGDLKAASSTLAVGYRQCFLWCFRSRGGTKDFGGMSHVGAPKLSVDA